MIGYLRSRAVDSIFRYYRETAHPHVALLPRARMGLHAVARTCFAPGDRVLISPLTCHTVMEAFVQGGVVPSFVNIDTRDGNIDVSALGRTSLQGVKAIVTTNLYGNPDSALELADIAKRHDLLLIEDCAHVFETTVAGGRVGSIGDISVFSFKKFFDVPGGVLAGKDAERVEKIREWLRHSCRFLSGPRELAGWGRRSLGKHLRNLHTIRRRTDGADSGRPAASVPPAESGAPGRGPRLRIADFNVYPLVEEMNHVAAVLADPGRFRDDWDRGNRELMGRIQLEYRKSPVPSTVVHMAVPFFAPNRNGLLGHLRARGVPVWYLYNPPMNDLYSGVIPGDPSLDLDRLEEWSQHILPLQGKYAGRILFEMAEMGETRKPTTDGTVRGESRCARP